MKKKRTNYHVIPRPKGWAVIREGGRRAVGFAKTQGNAIEIAESKAFRERTQVFVHAGSYLF